MIIPSYLVTLWAVLFVSCGPTVAQSVAVFDFELIDTSLEGAIRGVRPDEQERLARLSDQLRQRLRDSGRLSLVDITPIASEAQAVMAPTPLPKSLPIAPTFKADSVSPTILASKDGKLR